MMYDNGLYEIAKEIEQRVNDAVLRRAEAVRDDAVSFGGEDLTVLHNGNSAEIISNDDGTKEFGTAEETPSPYLVPALYANKEFFVSEIADAIENVGG